MLWSSSTIKILKELFSGMVIEEFKARPSVAMASASVNAFHECLLCAVEFDSIYKNGSMESRSVTAGNHGAKRRTACSTTRSEFE